MIEVRLTANAGVQIEYEAKKILVDGLHCEEGYPFSKVTPSMLEAMCQEDSEFHNADYVIFTHDDPDHYTSSVLLKYLKYNKISKLFLPTCQYNSMEQNKDLQQLLESCSFSYTYLGLSPGEKKHYILDDNIQMDVFGMRHLSEGSGCFGCDCILLKLAGKNMLFTSDCDFTEIERFSFLKEEHIDLAFVNPLFFHNQKGRDILNRYIDPKHIIIYHVPFQEDDQYQMRALVRQSLRKFSKDFSDVQAMMEPGALLKYFQ